MVIKEYSVSFFYWCILLIIDEFLVIASSSLCVCVLFYFVVKTIPTSDHGDVVRNILLLGKFLNHRSGKVVLVLYLELSRPISLDIRFIFA